MKKEDELFGDGPFGAAKNRQHNLFDDYLDAAPNST